jgi:hypothetical protein
VKVKVIRIEMRDDDAIVAICERGSKRQAIGLVDLRLTSPKPVGARWIEAYRHWRRAR